MAEPVASLVVGPDVDRSRVERAIVMHGTSAYRERAARMLAKLLTESGAEGVAYGWTDGLAPTLLSPVHVVTARPDVRWDLSLPATHVETIERDPPYEWKLALMGACPERLRRLASTLEYVKGFFAEAADRDVPGLPCERTQDAAPFVELLDIFGFCGFEVATKAVGVIRSAFRREVAGLPDAARAAATEVVETLGHSARLQPALLELGSVLDRAGRFDAAVRVHLVGYELAVLRCDGTDGIDAARAAGRSFRRMGDLERSLRWYRLAARIAELDEAWDRLALALDGAGNTYRHQGSFPKARKAYEEAWAYASLSGDETAIGNVAHSMMIVEREAGRLEAAASYGWTSLRHRPDPGARASLLLNLGTLLREGGDLTSAERAFRIAHHQADQTDLRALAADALAYSAALRNDGPAYVHWWAEARKADLREPFIRVQLGYFRGLSLAAFGETECARRVLRAVEGYARRWGLHEWEIKAAETEVPLPQSSPMDTPTEVRQGLRQLELASI